MAPPATARDELIKIRFLDLRASLVEETLIASDTTFTDFLTLLCDLSAGVARQDVSSSQVQAGGVNLSDGHWWYRVVKQMRTIDIGHMTHEPRIVKGGWQILNNHAAYDRLLAEMTLGINAEGGWVEVQHDEHSSNRRVVQQAAAENVNWGFAIPRHEPAFAQSQSQSSHQPPPHTTITQASGYCQYFQQEMTGAGSSVSSFGAMPSLQARHPPFPAQIGTPSPDTLKARQLYQHEWHHNLVADRYIEGDGPPSLDNTLDHDEWRGRGGQIAHHGGGQPTGLDTTMRGNNVRGAAFDAGCTFGPLIDWFPQGPEELGFQSYGSRMSPGQGLYATHDHDNVGTIPSLYQASTYLARAQHQAVPALPSVPPVLGQFDAPYPIDDFRTVPMQPQEVVPMAQIPDSPRGDQAFHPASYNPFNSQSIKVMGNDVMGESEVGALNNHHQPETRFDLSLPTWVHPRCHDNQIPACGTGISPPSEQSASPDLDSNSRLPAAWSEEYDHGCSQAADTDFHFPSSSHNHRRSSVEAAELWPIDVRSPHTGTTSDEGGFGEAQSIGSPYRENTPLRSETGEKSQSDPEPEQTAGTGTFDTPSPEATRLFSSPKTEMSDEKAQGASTHGSIAPGICTTISHAPIATGHDALLVDVDTVKKGSASRSQPAAALQPVVGNRKISRTTKAKENADMAQSRAERASQQSRERAARAMRRQGKKLAGTDLPHGAERGGIHRARHVRRGRNTITKGN